MGKILIIIITAIFFLMVTPGTVLSSETALNDQQKLELVGEFERGKLYQAGKISVLELSGSYRQMGRQYGMRLQEELHTLYDMAVEELFINERGFSRERLLTIAQAVYDPYPKRYKEIIEGMAETSGLGLENQKILNAIEWFPKINHLYYGRCSAIVTWGPYTSGKPLVFGRNNDDDPLYKDFARFLVVSVFKPTEGGYPTAVINYAGAVYNPTGMNSEGLFLEMNAGPWMGFSLDRVSIFTTLFSFLQDYGSIAEVDRAFNSMLSNISAIVTVADEESAVSYESSLFDTRRVDPEKEGLLAATNHFTGPDWNIAQVDDRLGEMSMKRRENLLALGNKYKGTFDPQVMMKVLDAPIDEGGPTVEGTIYQVVAVPENRTIWVKVPGLQEWTEIQLGYLLER